jgi:hypothetical protein
VSDELQRIDDAFERQKPGEAVAFLRQYLQRTPTLAAAVARIGRERFYDERKWLTARMPVAASALWPLAGE